MSNPKEKTVLDDKIKADIDQAQAMFIEMLPTLCHEFYIKCQQQGFTDEQSLILTREVIRSFVGANK